ncbi:hypothetical protein ACF1G0_02285 [Streptomyces sp. NPDC013953]|uniref:hypothetical protein n=1 Tax=Streptomyces sp. NPDC013953 TaxID=3364868 RepID=UPI0036F8F0DF
MTSTPRRGPLGWLRALFGGGPQRATTHLAPLASHAPHTAPEIDVPERIAVHRETLVSFETPAKGGGFDFHVDVRCHWCAEGRYDQTALHRTLEDHLAAMPQRLAERVRDVARAYEPFRAEDAEAAVNEALQEGECFDNGLVTCRTVAFLRPAPEVAEQQRQAALELQRIEHRYARSALQVRLLSDVTEEWRVFLAGGLAGVRQDEEASSWLTPWAVLLAEQPDKAATEVGDMFRQRQAQFEHFVKLLGRQKKEYEARDLFEFVVANEQQLGHAMRLFGLALPGEPGPGGGYDAGGPAEPLPRPGRT